MGEAETSLGPVGESPWKIPKFVGKCLVRGVRSRCFKYLLTVEDYLRNSYWDRFFIVSSRKDKAEATGGGLVVAWDGEIVLVVFGGFALFAGTLVSFSTWQQRFDRVKIQSGPVYSMFYH
jgi:hypothetical protein